MSRCPTERRPHLQARWSPARMLGSLKLAVGGVHATDIGNCYAGGFSVSFRAMAHHIARVPHSSDMGTHSDASTCATHWPQKGLNVDPTPSHALLGQLMSARFVGLWCTYLTPNGGLGIQGPAHR